MSSYSSTSTSNNNQDGIDIRLALDILSQRTTTTTPARPTTSTTSPFDIDAAMSNTTSNNTNNNGCSCCTTDPDEKQNIPPEVKNWGQIIDILGPTKDDHNNQNQNNTNNDDQNMKDDDNVNQQQNQNVLSNDDEIMLKQQQQIIKNERDSRQLILQEKIHNMSMIQLIQYILECQQQRVITYRTYDSGLQQLLITYNITQYPRICAEATASFAVLSDTIKLIHKEFASRGQTNDIIDCIQKLQKYESQKLNITAAYHLECIREQSQQSQSQQSQQSQYDNNQLTNNNNSVLGLLQQSIKSLKEQIQQCVMNINEVIEEIQEILVEEKDKEMEE